jgi:peptidoglycan hydrolase-like protein with peptidoglycan-binding domain
MINLISSLIFLVSFVPPNNLNNCKDIDQTHPVRSDIMLQVVLKSYGFYQGNIDGIFGNNSKKALVTFQSANNIKNDGIIGSETCSLLRNKKLIIKNTLSTDSKKNITLENKYSQEIYDAQIILKKLGLYSSDVDGLNGPGTIRALKNFQSKAGLNTDGVLGPNTKSALDKGEDSYVTVNTSTPVVDTETKSSSMVDQSSPLDLRNYDPTKTCIVGYVDINGVWVPDPCFKPVFVYRFGKTAQVNSQQELDAYLADRWSLQKEKTYTTIGRVKTENYTDGVNSPVNGLIMPSNANNSIVIGIKNDNNVRARPQSGPQNADAVFEVLVEGGMTRFINIFYESDTTYHGPIRSARPTDPTVLRPLDGVLVASGATGGLIPEIIDMGVPVITDRRPDYFRISSRKAPHNLYADTYKLKSTAISKGYKKSLNPQPLFPWGDPNINSWSSVNSLKLQFSSQTSTTWTWNGTTYNRTYYDAYKGSSSENVHNWINQDQTTGQISFPTVIALFCEPYIHPLQLPSVKTVGEGRAIIMHKGKMLDARWKRGSNLDPFHIVDNNGNSLVIPKGKPWISLVPITYPPSFNN